jgi:hypothetical protein
MTTTTKSQFAGRGIMGVLSLMTGIWIAMTFKESSNWPVSTKAVMIAIAYCAAIGGVALFGSYYKQAEFKQLKASLLPMAVVLATLVLIQLSKLI